MSLRRYALALLFAALTLAPTADAQVQARNPAGLDRETQAQRVLDVLGPEHVLREAWRTTTRYFYDKSKLPEAWDGAVDKYLAKIRGAKTPVQVHAVTNEMLGEAKASHLVLLERRVFLRELMCEFRNGTAVRADCELVELDGALYVGGMTAGGAAAEAGLLTGDEVLTIDGKPPGTDVLDPAGHDPALGGPHGFFLNLTPEAHTITVRRERGAAPLELSLTPKAWSQIKGCEASVEVVEHEGAKLGVIRLYHFINPRVVKILDDALTGAFADCDALVLDVRGRGGSPMVVSAILNRFSGRRATWERPVVCLIDSGSRSAKEAFAYAWRKKKIGPLIGETTAGAVIACTFRQLSDGSVICLPVKEASSLSDGVVLEGVGVDPTEPVDQHALPYRQGRDAIKAAGIARAAELAAKAPGARAF